MSEIVAALPERAERLWGCLEAIGEPHNIDFWGMCSFLKFKGFVVKGDDEMLTLATLKAPSEASTPPESPREAPKESAEVAQLRIIEELRKQRAEWPPEDWLPPNPPTPPRSERRANPLTAADMTTTSLPTSVKVDLGASGRIGERPRVPPPPQAQPLGSVVPPPHLKQRACSSPEGDSLQRCQEA